MDDRKFSAILRGAGVMDSDWSLSPGYSIHALADNVDAAASRRRSKVAIREFIANVASPEHAGSSGYSLQFDHDGSS